MPGRKNRIYKKNSWEWYLLHQAHLLKTKSNLSEGKRITESVKYMMFKKKITQCYKNIYAWRKTTPNYIRRETGVNNLELIILEN